MKELYHYIKTDSINLDELFRVLGSDEEVSVGAFRDELDRILVQHTGLPKHSKLMKMSGKFQDYVKIITGESNPRFYRVEEVLREWDGLWRQYPAFLSELKDRFNIDMKRDELKDHLQKLVSYKLACYGPLWDSDGIPCGSGYTHVTGEWEI